MTPRFAIITDGGQAHAVAKAQVHPVWEYDELTRRTGCPTVYLGDLATRAKLLKTLGRYGDPKKWIGLQHQLAPFNVILAMSEASGWDGVVAAKISGWKGHLFIIFHGQRWWSKRNRWMAWLAKSMPKVHFLCLSPALKQLLEREYRIPPDRAHITSFGVDIDFFDAPHSSSQRTSKLIMSAGTASRDYRTLNEAVRGLGIATRIAADSDWHREPLNLKTEDLAPEVMLSSAGDLHQLRLLYQQASLVVVPLKEVYYACGYAVIAQAMAMRKAVIASLTSCPTDMIVDGVTGLYVRPGDVRDLREAIRKLISEPGLAESMGQAARARMESMFNTRAYVDRICGVVMTTAGEDLTQSISRRGA